RTLLLPHALHHGHPSGDEPLISDVRQTGSSPFAFWREMSSKMWMPLDAHCEPGLEGTFQAHVALSGLGLVQATLLTAPSLTIQRTPQLIRRSDPETFFVTCTVRGHAIG
ncbi:hypothetical protein ABZU32_20585, partial [Sphaerisporangium sp. NPDC005288]